MTTELSVIKGFLSYYVWNTYHTFVGVDDFPEDLRNLYRVLDVFHKTQNEGEQDLHLFDLANLFFSQYKNNKSFYEGVFNTLEKYEPNISTLKSLLVSMKRAKLLRELSIASYEAAEGKKPYEQVQQLLAALSEEKEEDRQRDDFVTDDLQDLLDSTYATPGLRWRLNALCQSIGSLRKGDFGFIFARPETGKTTFLSSEVTHMAEQLSDGEVVLWLNAEEVNAKVKSRVYQAACGVTLEQLLSNPVKWDTLYKSKLAGRILIPNQNTYSKWDVERLCKKYKPVLIVIDQLSKINGFTADRDDLELGAKFQWARELAKQYGPVIAVTQADGSGENKKWLTMANVANAKTSVQAEADWILGIGAISDTGWEDFRFLNISKNKLAGDKDTDPALRHGKLTVKIDKEHARYVDI